MSRKVPLLAHLQKVKATTDAMYHYRNIQQKVLDHAKEPVIISLPLEYDGWRWRHHIAVIGKDAVLVLDDGQTRFYIEGCHHWRVWNDRDGAFSVWLDKHPAPFLMLRPFPAFTHTGLSALPGKPRSPIINIGLESCDQLCAYLGVRAAACLRQYISECGMKLSPRDLPAISALDN